MDDLNDILNNQPENEENENIKPSDDFTEEQPIRAENILPPPSVAQQFNQNRINNTPVTPTNNYKPANKGLKVFAAMLAGAIILTAACVGGYFLGKTTQTGGKVDVDLSAKPTDTDQYTVAQVYDKLNKSVVGIRVYNTAGAMADATGVIYMADGYIVTNDHIYSEIPAAKFKVFMYDGTEYNAKYVAGDVVSDLAVLKVEGASDFSVPDFGNSNELVNGEGVVAVGRPSDATGDTSVTSGVVSHTKRRVQTTSSYSARLIQTDSAINPGSSGGALVNMYGQVVGITSSKLAGEDYDAIGFAIPTTTVKRVVEQLITDKKVTDRAKLGITYNEVNSVTAEIGGFETTGLYIVTVSSDSDISGKVFEGDIITHINQKKITNDDIILDVIEESRAGDTVTLTVLSTKGRSTDYKVVLKANVGESSYSDMDIPSGEGNNDGTFDFPDGE